MFVIGQLQCNSNGHGNADLHNDDDDKEGEADGDDAGWPGRSILSTNYRPPLKSVSVQCTKEIFLDYPFQLY